MSACRDSNQIINKRDPAVELIRKYISQIYKDELKINEIQIEQLSWVIDNPVATPDMDTREVIETIHREIPRALARVYCLQLLRRGSEQDYSIFIAPQRAADSSNTLNYGSFTTLSNRIRKLDAVSYETLEATAIISAVTLSPKAKDRAFKYIRHPSVDSVQFLTQTAPYAGDIYPLARHVMDKYHCSAKTFEVAFMPHSHLRHMMYNEGSLAMYKHITQAANTGAITQETLDFWYDHWLANIAGFRGHLAPEGSLYLDQNTFMAMTRVKDILDDILQGVQLNPMQAYLTSRAQWLNLDKLTRDTGELIALGSIGASLRLFSPEQGKELFNGIKQLGSADLQHWIKHVQEQLKVQPYPAETHGPALFANAREVVGLTETIRKVLPVYMNVLDEEKKLRKTGKLSPDLPVSFQELASKENIDLILRAQQPLAITINLITGTASINKPILTTLKFME